jgi:hypothetical protein
VLAHRGRMLKRPYPAGASPPPTKGPHTTFTRRAPAPLPRQVGVNGANGVQTAWVASFLEGPDKALGLAAYNTFGQLGAAGTGGGSAAGGLPVSAPPRCLPHPGRQTNPRARP